MQRADTALYQTKGKGRDCVVIRQKKDNLVRFTRGGKHTTHNYTFFSLQDHNTIEFARDTK
ncbi:hypothetical protein ACFL3A_12510 [Pseudomonadota bacterium]